MPKMTHYHNFGNLYYFMCRGYGWRIMILFLFTFSETKWLPIPIIKLCWVMMMLKVFTVLKYLCRKPSMSRLGPRWIRSEQGLLKAENFHTKDLLYFSFFWTVFTLVRSFRNIAAKSRRKIHHVFNKQCSTYFAGGLHRVPGHDTDPAVCAGQHHGHLRCERQVLSNMDQVNNYWVLIGKSFWRVFTTFCLSTSAVPTFFVLSSPSLFLLFTLGKKELKPGLVLGKVLRFLSFRYAVAAGVTESNIAFCLIYTFRCDSTSHHPRIPELSVWLEIQFSLMISRSYFLCL